MQANTNPTSTDYQEDLSTYWTPTQAKFYSSERCDTARRMLQDLVNNITHETDSSYYTGGLDFCERHLDYLSRHPNVELVGYMSNLKLMTRKRTA